MDVIENFRYVRSNHIVWVDTSQFLKHFFEKQILDRTLVLVKIWGNNFVTVRFHTRLNPFDKSERRYWEQMPKFRFSSSRDGTEEWIDFPVSVIFFVRFFKSNFTLQCKMKRAVRTISLAYRRYRAMKTIKINLIPWVRKRLEIAYAPGGRLVPEPAWGRKPQ